MATVKKYSHRPHSKALEGLYNDISSLLKLLHLSHEAIICIDEDQNIVVFNDGAEKVFGFKQKEIIGEPLARLIPDKFHKQHNRDVKGFAVGNKKAKLMARREPVMGRRKDGEEFIAHASISKFNYGGETTMTVVMHEIVSVPGK
jgi:PAS domain S-box-containing protein